MVGSKGRLINTCIILPLHSYFQTFSWFYVTLDLKTSLSALFTKRTLDKGRKEGRESRRGGKAEGRKSLKSYFSLSVVLLKMVTEDGLSSGSFLLHFSGVINKCFLLSYLKPIYFYSGAESIASPLQWDFKILSSVKVALFLHVNFLSAAKKIEVFWYP